jgi:dTDP-4-dehydrorhamnose reductase
MDRVQFAKELARGFDLDPSLIVGKTTAELGQVTPRPLSGGLLSPRLESLLPGVMRPLADCMVDYHDRLDSTEGLAYPFPPGDLLADATPLEPRIL